MRIFYQNDQSDNAHATFCNLLISLGIKSTRKYLTQIKVHPNYPSLLAITDCLNDLGVASLATRINEEQLKEIPYPAIAHLHKNNGHFVVLKQLADKKMHYIDPEAGVVIEPVEEFEKKWTGVALLVEAKEKSGEADYKQKRKSEIFSSGSLYLSGSLVSVMLLWSAFILGPLLLYFLKVLGFIICMLLLQKQFGGGNTYIAAICRIGSKTDCDAVIHSPASRLFGLIHLSEIGLWYFFGGSLWLALSTIVGAPGTGVLLLLNILALPLSLFSIYYQGWVIKKWCPLCLIVMGIFWVEFFLLWPPLSKLFVSVTGLYLVFVSFSLPLAFWLAVRERFIDSFKVPGMERTLNKFMRSEKIFKALLNQEAEVNLGDFTNEIQVGANNPPVELTVVSNPMCGPCSYAHRIIEELVERFGEKLKVRFRFAVDSSGTNSDATKMVRHLAALSLANSNGHAVKSLSAWFSQNGRMNVNRWKEDHPIETVNENEVDLVLGEHDAWCRQVNIQATPTIFINGKKLPSEYTVNDLKYHIRNFMDN